MAVPDFDEYLGSLGRLSVHVDPLATTEESERIRWGAAALAELDAVDAESLAAWVLANPEEASLLGLVVGLTQERMKNVLRERFATTSARQLALRDPVALVRFFDEEYDLVRTLAANRAATFTFGDLLVARAGSRARAAAAGRSGRRIEDQIEAIAVGLGLEVRTRTRFQGRGHDAPADLLVMRGDEPVIAVAAKGFDSTGSKLGDAVREIVEMASVRKPTQYVMAVVDGIGWLSRQSDLRRIHALWAGGEIDGLYTLATLDRFRDDLEQAARRLDLL